MATTEEVREAFILHNGNGWEEDSATFDAWLAEHVKTVRAEGFNAGWRAVDVEYREGYGEVNPIDGSVLRDPVPE